MKDLVLKIKWGGLGDHLLYSPIPRVAKQMGYDHVYISNHSEYRNPHTKTLVWKWNPFIDGFTDQDADYPNFAETRPGFNILDDIMHFYGVPDDGVRYREPEIHHHFYPLLSHFKNSNVFDPNSVNTTGIPTQDQIENYFTKEKIEIDCEMGDIYQKRSIERRDAIYCDLFQLCDVIVSCKHFYCLTTGSATLAAALGKPSTVLYVDGVKPMFHHSKLHKYVNIGDINC